MIELNEENAEILNEMLKEEESELLSRIKFDLNTLLPEDLEKIPYLGSKDILLISDYLQKQRPLLSVYELQSIPGISLSNLRKALPYITVNPLDKAKVTSHTLHRSGENSLSVRWSRELPIEKLFRQSDTLGSSYLGSPDKLLFRFMHKSPGKYSAGFILEKDAGEDWFNRKTIPFIDYYSAHIAVHNLTPKLTYIIVGDYILNLGQGLIVDNSFSVSRSFQFGLMAKTSQLLKAYNSVQENRMFRGCAAKFGLTKRITAVLFYSRVNIDANIITEDSTSEYSRELLYSSIQLGGLHRTRGELEDKNALIQQHGGVGIDYRFKTLTVGFNSVYSKNNGVRDFQQPYLTAFENLPSEQLSSSIHHLLVAKKFTSFGEIAFTDKWRASIMQGILLGLGKASEVFLQYRNIHPIYKYVLSRTVSTNDYQGNERGLLLGLNFSPAKRIVITLFAEQFYHPWVKFNTPFPTTSSNYTAKVSYTMRKFWQTYLQYRCKQFQNRGDNINFEKESGIEKIVEHQIRWSIESKLDGTWTWRTRFEYKLQKENSSILHGYALAFDLLFKSTEHPFSGNIRVALIDANQFESRIYMYENDVLNSFSLPFYSGRGTRCYLNLRYRIGKNLTVESKVSTQYFATDSYNRSQNEFGNHPFQTEIKFQMRYNF